MKKSDKQIASKGLTPERLTGIVKKTPEKKSAGVKAVFAAIKQVKKYTRISDTLKLSLKMNQKGGFDCPGCAWPDPADERSAIGEYCENGIKAIAEETQKQAIDRAFFQKNSIPSMLAWSDFEIGKAGRLSEPMIVREGKNHYEPISWSEAFALIADKLKTTEPNQAAFYTSGRTSNEAAFLYQLFVRAYGTNNLPDCSNMCHESSGVALASVLGIGKGSVTLEDFYNAELLIIYGQNPGTNHPRMLSALEKCKKNGGKIITINPIKEAGLINFVNPQNPLKIISGGTNLTDLYIQIPVNRDLEITKAVIKILCQREQENPGKIFDRDFIKEKTANYDAFIKSIEEEDVDELIRLSGVAKEVVYQFADMVASSDKIITCWAMGLTQHKNAVNVIKEIVNLLLVKGSIGKEGAGTCPVRGHSNVQGDRTMGIWESPKEPFLQKLDEAFTIRSPRKPGYNAVETVAAMKSGKLKVFFALGGNFLSAMADTAITAQSLKNCDLTVHVSTKLNRSHLIHGKTALILPCKGRTDKDIQNSQEQFVTVESSTGYISTSQGVLPLRSKMLKSEIEIIAQIAQATLPDNANIDWIAMSKDYNLIRDHIGRVIPGFEDFNQKISRDKGFYLPNGARTAQFTTPDGKAHFSINTISHKECSEQDEFTMITIRSHDQFNSTIYGLDDRYRGIYNERRVVMINAEDAGKAGLFEGDEVDITSFYDGIERRVNLFKIVYYDISKGCIATYFPETNAVAPFTQTALESETPIYKSVRVKLHKRRSSD